MDLGQGALGWVAALLGFDFANYWHHRVEHEIRVLIVWDRLFGTFEPERAPVEYGLSTNITSYNPFAIAFHGYAERARDCRRARDYGNGTLT